jgi:hypothetical protein
MFGFEVDGRPAGIEDVFEGFGEHDRLGLVMSRPCGAVGASALLTATITAFYDIHRARSDEFFAYPDYYLFHVGGPLGEHGRLDIWPRRKEVVVEADPDRILEAVDDRGITRLLVEDASRGLAPPDPRGTWPASGDAAAVRLADEAVASARSRIRTCLAYSAAGRVRDADVRVRSNPVSEGYVETVLLERSKDIDPDVRRAILAARGELVEDGAPVESYRRAGLDEALALLG